MKQVMELKAEATGRGRAPKLTLFLAGISLAALLGGCVVAPAYPPPGAYGYAPGYGYGYAYAPSYYGYYGGYYGRPHRYW